MKANISDDSEHKYASITAIIRTAILSGKYPPNTKLDTEKVLSERFNVSRQTVRHALELLENDGLIKRRQGSGTFICGDEEKRDQKLKTIGIIVTYISEYILPSMIRGIEEVLAENGYSFKLLSTGNRIDSEKEVLDYFIGNPVDGIIAEGSKTAFPNPNLSLYSKLITMGLPLVFLSSYYPALGKCVYVATDDYGGGKLAAELLISKGHRSIGGIFKADDNQGHDRFAGFIDAARAGGIELHDRSLLWYTTEQRENFFDNRNVDNVLEALSDCTAVICYNDQIAASFLSVLLKTGKRVPEDVAIISFDDSSYASTAPVKITSLAHPKEMIGRVAARKLLNMIQGRKETSAILDWTLVERESTMFDRVD